MRKKHVVALMMATVMAVSVLGGCGGSSSSGKSAKSPTLQRRLAELDWK